MAMLKEWRKRKIGDLFDVQLGKMLNKAASNGPDQREYLTNINVRWGGFDLTNLNRMHFSERDRDKFRLIAGDLIVCEGGEVGRCAIWRDEHNDCYYQKALHRLRRRSSDILPEYTYQYFQFGAASGLFSEYSTRSSIAHLTREKLVQVPIPVPPLPEQVRISEVLQTWDAAREKLTTIRDAKEQRLVGLRAALLFGELRLNGQRRNWSPTRLGAVTHELTKRNGAKGLGRDFVMGVTKADGVVPMREQTIAGDISRYKRLPPRAFAYNPMRINVGSIAINEREDEVLVSPDYVVFACNADGLDPDYLDHLRKTSWWAHYINSGGSGSVRQRTYYDDLAALKLPLPELDEQKAIAAVLNTARADLIATEREIEAVTLQKRGLMQKLLTGEWRVSLDPSELSAATEETEHAG